MLEARAVPSRHTLLEALARPPELYVSGESRVPYVQICDKYLGTWKAPCRVRCWFTLICDLAILKPIPKQGPQWPRPALGAAVLACRAVLSGLMLAALRSLPE